MNEKEEINWFTRIMVILLALFIVFVIIMKLFYYKSPFEIDEYMIICLLILSILVLSESYNSFSIGKIFSLNKKVEEKEKTNQELKKENTNLREQITNIVNKISVNQQFNFGDFKLSPASEEDKKEKKQAEQEEIKTLVNDNETISNKDQDKRAKAFRVSESLALKEFSKELPPDVSLNRNLRIQGDKMELDPYMKRIIMFDGFAKLGGTELFVETKISTQSKSLEFDIYNKLSVLKRYAEVKNVNTRLIMLFPVLPEEYLRNPISNINRSKDIAKLRKTFSQAINSGALDIRPIDLTKEEIEKEILSRNKDTE